MKYQITHSTHYKYTDAVGTCHNEVRLTPRALPNQLCPSSLIDVTPVPSAILGRRDFFGNTVNYFSIQHPHNELRIIAKSEVERLVTDIPDFSASPAWEDIRDGLRKQTSLEALEARQFVLDSTFATRAQEFATYACHSFPPEKKFLPGVDDLMRRIHSDFKYAPGTTTIATPLSLVMEQKKGVCQDFAHLAIACLRSIGLPARYVSGYLETDSPPGKEKLAGSDASHAWFAVFDPNLGWIDFDPTNNIIPAERHITLAWGRDFSDVTPLKGVIFGSGKHKLSVSVDVQRKG